MNPSISKALKDGFSAANKGWLGILFYAGCWIVAALIGLGILLLSAPPVKTLVDEAAKMRQEAPVPAEKETAAPAEKSEEAALPDLSPEAEEKIGKWLQKGWPFLVLAVLFLLAAGLWLYAGQIGYLAKLVRGEPASFLDILASGLQTFLPALGAALLSLLIFGLPLLLAAGLGIPLAPLLPRWLTVAVLTLFTLLFAAASVWLGVRLFFWFTAVLADRLGPVEAFKASLGLTQGRWGWTFLFALILTLIPVGVDMIFRLLQWLGSLAGGVVGGIFTVVFTLASLAVGIWLPFFSAASTVQFYDEAKRSSAPI